MNTIKFILIALAILLLIFMIKGALIGAAIFFVFLRYAVIAALIALVIYFYIKVTKRNQ